jgi:isopenicillin-N N-acyltransferase-like protein
VAAVYPSVRVCGGPHERGFAYGLASRQRVRASLAGYRSKFESLGTDWRVVRRIAQQARGRVVDFAPAAALEMRGLAAGAGVGELDVLALNLRTEILALAQGEGSSLPAECTAFAVPPERSVDGHVLLAQNWDWLTHSARTLVVLEVERDDAPGFVTVVEAGLVAKIGLNAAGLGIATNALRVTSDPAERGIPYHILLRSLFDCESAAEAAALVRRASHASSANYLLAGADAMCVDLEAEAGEPGARELTSANGILCHTNHFLTHTARTDDLGPSRYPSTTRRLQFAQTTAAKTEAVSVELLKQALADHDGYPLSVCAHRDESAPPEERGLTAASLIMDLTSVRAWLADGNPCIHAFRELDCEFLRRPQTSATAQAAGLAAYRST